MNTDFVSAFERAVEMVEEAVATRYCPLARPLILMSRNAAAGPRRRYNHQRTRQIDAAKPPSFRPRVAPEVQRELEERLRRWSMRPVRS